MLYKHLLPKAENNFAPIACAECPIKNARKVGSRGDQKSPLVILGESPGNEELRYFTPFCGSGGDLLDKSVPADFDFDKAYIINAMQCRIKTNNAAKDKELKIKACKACRNRTLSQIFSHPRKCILALGAWANSALTGNFDFKITSKRGIIYEITNPLTGEKIPVVPAVHPAFLLRGGGNIKSFQDDVAEAFALAFSSYSNPRPRSAWTEPKTSVITESASIDAYHNDLINLAGDGQIEVAADIETSGFNTFTDRILCIGFYHPGVGDDTGVVIPIHPKYTWNIPDIDEKSVEALKRLLANPKLRFIWQFGKFDEKFLRQGKFISNDRAIVQEDAGLLSYAMSEATKDHDLDEQAKNTLGAPDHKQILKQWVPKRSDSFEKIPPKVLWDYLVKDVKKTYLLWQYNRPIVRSDSSLEKLYTRTLIPASHLLVDIEMYGIAVDWNYVRINREGAVQKDLDEKLIKDIEEEKGLEWKLTNIKAQLLAIVGYPVNPNSPNEVSTLLYDRFNLNIKGKKPTDTSKETLEKLPKHPAVNLVRQYRSTVKMLSTYVKAIEKLAVKDRIHTTFKLHVTPTGRLSSTDPNLQNIPRESRFRRMYRASPGFELMEGDYNSAELRMLAVVSKDKFLTEIFLDDKRNLHDEVSIDMYGPNFTSDQRIRAKAINFGIPYGREAFSVAEEFDITTTEAQRLIDAWFARCPEAKAFLDRSRGAPISGRTLVTTFGRKRRPGVVSRERLHGLMNEFANFHMQSPISDFTLHAAMEMKPLLKKEGANIVNLIHDAVLTEFPSDSLERKQQVAYIVKETMETVPTKWVNTPIKFVVDLKCGHLWGLLEKYK